MSLNNVAESAVTAALKLSTGGLSQNEPLFAGLTGDDLVRAKAQFLLQKQQETVAFVTKVLKNETAMQVLNNLR